MKCWRYGKRTAISISLIYCKWGGLNDRPQFLYGERKCSTDGQSEDVCPQMRKGKTNMNQKNNIRRIADYCISEGTEHSEDGRWQISYNELYDLFDAKISDTNGNGKLLRRELQQREEINELIITEDCIEMTYHLEYCQNCQRGGIESTAILLSLMGCNLYEEHFTDESEGRDIKATSSIRQEQSEASAPALSM